MGFFDDDDDVVEEKKQVNSSAKSTKRMQEHDDIDVVDDTKLPKIVDVDIDVFDDSESDDKKNINLTLGDGKNFVYMLPPTEGMVRPWQEYEQHFLYEKEHLADWFGLSEWPDSVPWTVLCERSEQRYLTIPVTGSCVVCDHIKELRHGRRKDRLIAKKWGAQRVCLANTRLLTADGKSEAKVWRITSKPIMRDLLAIAKAGYKFWRPSGLHLLRVTKTGKGQQTRYTVGLADKDRPPKVMPKAWLTEMYDLRESIPKQVEDLEEWKEYLEAIFENYDPKGRRHEDDSVADGGGKDKYGFARGSNTNEDDDDIPWDQ